MDGDSPGYVLADFLLYGFHLSVFALLAGLFVRRGVEKQGQRSYLWSRDATFLYLYVLWSLIQGGVKLLTAGLVNTPVTPLEVLDLLHPEGHLWFLPWLLIATTLAVIAKPWLSRPRAFASLAVTFVISLALWGYAGTVVGPEGLPLWMFFAVGVLVGDERFRAIISRVNPWSALGLAFLTGILYVSAMGLLHVTAPTVGFEIRTPSSVALGVAASWVGVLSVLAFSKVVATVTPKAVVRGYAFLGKRSLEIYLAHGVALSGTRILLASLGVSSLPLHLLAGICAGVAGPLLLWLVAQKLGQFWLFSPPRALLPRT